MIYQTYKECIDAEKIPRNTLSLAKSMKAPGFNYTSGSSRINWDELKPWLEEHKEMLEEAESTSPTEWKNRLTRAKALQEEMNLEEMKNTYIKKEEVRALFKQIQSAMRSLLITKYGQEISFQQLGLTLPELEKVNKQAMTDICNLFQQGIEKHLK